MSKMNFKVVSTNKFRIRPPINLSGISNEKKSLPNRADEIDNPFSLSPIIEEVTSPSDVKIMNGTVQKLVKLDVNSGRIISQNLSSIFQHMQSFFRFSVSPTRFFLINISGKTTTPNQVYKLNLQDKEVVLHVTSRISFNNNLTALVEQFAKTNQPVLLFNQKMEEWLNQVFEEERTDTVQNLFVIRSRAQRAIEDRFETLGLKLNVSIKLENEDIVEKTFDIDKKESFSVQLKGLNELFSVKYKAVISAHVDFKTFVILNFETFDALPERIARYLSQSFGDYEYSDVANGLTTEIQNLILDAVNEKMIIHKEGWKIDNLIIELDKEDFKLIDHLVIKDELSQLTIKTDHGKPEEIEIYNTLILNLQDTQRARIMKKYTKDLETWAKRILSQVSSNVLINASYSDLIIKQKELENLVRERLSEKAKDIGYVINNFFTIADIEHIKLGDPFDFSTDGDIEFDTKIGDRVKIQITVQNARIINFEKIRNYLTPDRDIVTEMKRVIIEKVRVFLQNVDPDDYYSKFETSLRESLSQFIKQILIESFSLGENVEISLRQFKTDLILRLEKLQQGFHSFDFKSQGLISYSGLFSVMAIDLDSGWVIFKKNNFENIKNEIDAIRIHLKNFIESLLIDKSYIKFANENDERCSSSIVNIIENAQKHIQNKFGLLIEVSSLKRGESLTEEIRRIEIDAYKKNQLMEIYSKEKSAQDIITFKHRILTQIQNDLLVATAQKDNREISRLEKEHEAISGKIFKDFSIEEEFKELKIEPSDDHEILTSEE